MTQTKKSSERVDKAVEAHKKGEEVQNVTAYEKRMITSDYGKLIQDKPQ